MNKRYIYPAGFISLLFLPILGLWQLNQFHIFDKFGLVEAFYFSNEQPTCINFKSHPELNYTTFNINGNKGSDRINLDLAQLEIRKLTQSKSLKNGVCIHFGDSTKLWALVKAFEICKLEKAENYIGEGVEIWVYNTNRLENYQFGAEVFNAFELHCIDFKELENEKQFVFNPKWIVLGFLTLILYLILVAFTINKTRTFNRN